MRIPNDVKEMTEKYLIDKGGICGQSCLAVIEGISIEEVLCNWKKFGMEFKGYSGWKQLREYLENRGYEIKLLRKDNWGDFNKNDYCILRIQWTGEGEKKEKPFYGWGHWTEASAHTHFIVVHNNQFFCNEDGLFNMDNLEEYLNGGVITSIMRCVSQIQPNKSNTKLEPKGQKSTQS